MFPSWAEIVPAIFPTSHQHFPCVIKIKIWTKFDVLIQSKKTDLSFEKLNLIGWLFPDNNKRTCNNAYFISIIDNYLDTWFIGRFCSCILNFYDTSWLSIRNCKVEGAVYWELIAGNDVVVWLREMNFLTWGSEEGKLKWGFRSHSDDRTWFKLKSFMDWDSYFISQMFVAWLDASCNNFEISGSQSLNNNHVALIPTFFNVFPCS